MKSLNGRTLDKKNLIMYNSITIQTNKKNEFFIRECGSMHRVNNEFELLFNDFHCEKDRALNENADILDILDIEWTGIIITSRTGQSAIKYSSCQKITDREALEFIIANGAELFQKGQGNTYHTFSYNNIFYNMIPIRKKDNYYVVYLLYARNGKAYTQKELEWAFLESNLTYQKVLLENKTTQMKGYIDNILNLSELITFIFDRNLDIVTMSNMGKKLLGNGNNLRNLAIEEIDYIIHNAENIFVSEYSHSLKKKVVTKHQQHILKVTIGPFYDSTGLLVGGILIAVDVTEKSIREYEIEQKKLFSMVGDTAAMLAHDVNNPLMNIQSCAQLLSHDQTLTEQGRQEFLNYIIQESERIELSINELFSYVNAINNNGYELVQLKDILKNCVSIIKPKARLLKVDIQMDIQENLPYIKAKNLELQQVFARILFNSLEAMPMGGNLFIHSNYDSDQNCTVTSISDTGIGISAENLKKLFRPYFTTKHGGHGLGLYTSKNIIEHYGGSITFDSMENKGTSCIIQLPVSV